MGHKNLLVAFCLVLSLASAYGTSNCYQCTSGAGEAESDSCESKVEKGETSSCPTLRPDCMKMHGQVDGKDVTLKSCADLSWEVILGSKDTCMKSTDVPNFEFKFGGRVATLDDGVVCICSSDKCNPAGRTVPAVGNIAIFLSALFFGKMIL